MREAAARGRPLQALRRPLARPRSEARRRPGVKPVIRLKAPIDGETVIDDHVQGRVVFQNSDLDDMIILRSDGTPIYNHAVVVDDHDMGDHPRDPRRRPPHQRGAAGADLCGHGLGRSRYSRTCR